MSEERVRYEPTKWSLKDLFPSHECAEIEQAMNDLDRVTAEIESMRPLLSPKIGSADFDNALGALQRFVKTVHRLEAYGQLWFSEDTQNQASLAFISRIEQLLTEAGNRVLFFTLWWRKLDDETAGRLLPSGGDLRYYLTQIRRFKDHTLAESEEKIINLKDLNGINALDRLYDIITNKFVFDLEIEGRKTALTREELMVHARSPVPEMREAAYRELLGVYGRESTVLSQIYLHRVRDWANEHLGLRYYSSPIAVRNLSNDIPDAVVDTLLTVCAEEAGVFQRYFRMKADWLALPGGKLRRYDLYAPLLRKSSRTIPYHDAVEMVLDSLQRFSPEAGERARRVFEEKHVDSELRAGKRSGAFCYGVLPGLTPWVLVNYTGEPRQIATLAHELGHAVHALMASDRSVLTFHSTLPMAETASVFSELLLTDRLLAEESDKDVRRGLIAEAIDDIYATVLRQAFFVRFEREAHRMVAENCTVDDINRLYLSTLTGQFGDAVQVSDDFQHEWIGIPHLYHSPFYCYAYSFGQLLSLSLYHRYKTEGRTFVPEFLRILSYGGSASPGEILSEARVDMADAGFWRGGFRAIEGMINELEKSC